MCERVCVRVVCVREKERECACGVCERKRECVVCATEKGEPLRGPREDHLATSFLVLCLMCAKFDLFVDGVEHQVARSFVDLEAGAPARST